ncbi:MAG: PEP-CTERM sorting domain-containing protein [Planctomycetota bacterium]
MKKSLTVLLVTFFAVSLSPFVTAETVLISDGFDSYGAGSNIAGPDWNPKWQTGSTQQNLFKGGSGYATIDLTLAERNYHIVNQTSFTVNSGDTVKVSSDVQYTHAGLGNGTALNQNFIGFLLTDQPQWWNGANKDSSIANRGGALGNLLPAAPWVENWFPHTNVGVSTNAGTAQTSDWFSIELMLSVNGGGNIEGSLTLDNGSSSFTTTPVDLGFAAGTTLYAGYTTAWNGSADPIATTTGISSVNVDNFAVSSVTAVPEPTSLVALSALGLGCICRRRRSSV